MKKWHKISLSIISILIVLILISLATSGGRFFWKQTVILPILKPFSEPCGYGGTSGMEVQCKCDGSLISDVGIGSTNYYCTDTCGDCKCFEVNFSDGSKTEVDCATFSQLDWAFPLE